MAENKGKYQPWSHEEFMADIRVRRMSPTALKTYMMLLHEAFVCETRPNLPDDEEKLELMAYCSSRDEWLSVRDSVLGMFNRELVDGTPVLSRKRLQDDWNKIQEIRESRAGAGRASAEARKRLTEVNKCSTNVNKEVKEVSKEREEKEEKQESAPDSFLPETDGQEEQDNEMKIDRQIDALTQKYFGRKAFLRGRNGEDLKSLVLVHKGSSVERAYEQWCELNQDNPDIKDPVAVFLEAADEFLGAETPARASARDPEVVSLVRELSYASGGVLAFMDKQRVRLAEVLKEFSSEEIIHAFKTWLGDQDLSDPKNVSFLPGKFVQIVDGLAYAARRLKQEADAARIQRDAATLRLQAEAEAERRKLEAEKAKEDGLFDPLA